MATLTRTGAEARALKREDLEAESDSIVPLSMGPGVAWRLGVSALAVFLVIVLVMQFGF